jgi:uncharacterized repeat protein (TIGR01451 family)
MKIKNIIILAIMIFFVIDLMTFVCEALIDVPEGNIEWTDPQEKTLGLAERFTRDNFIIEASDFYDNTILVTIYDGTIYQSCIPFCSSRVISKTLGRMGDSWNVTDDSGYIEMNILIKDLKEIRGNIGAYEGVNVVVDQRATIRTMIIGKPIPKLSILPEERKVNNRTFVDRTFTPGSEISINFSIKNDGKAILRNPHFVLNKSDFEGLELSYQNENLDRELPELKPNESTVINIKFKTPYVKERKNFKIHANVTGNDVFGRTYSATDDTYITSRPWVENLVEVKKYVPEKIYINDLVYVTIYIKNNGSTNISNVSLTESIPSEFEPFDNLSNFSNLTLRGHENKQIIYRLKPKRPGIYTFPENSSVVQWESENGINGGIEYNHKSSRVIVSGPYVELKKSGFIKGKDLKINIDARNTGDRTAVVRIMDLAPGKGYIYQSLIIHPSRSVQFSYDVDKNNITNVTKDGKAILQPVDAIVYDQFLFSNEKYTQKALSNYLVLDMTG